MKTIKAVNFGSSETDLAKYASECDPRISIITHKSGMSCAALPRLNTVEHLKLCAKIQKNTGVKTFALSMWTSSPNDATSRSMWENAARL
jgi:hypothetical protein